jgi:hypothetical protein
VLQGKEQNKSEKRQAETEKVRNMLDMEQEYSKNRREKHQTEELREEKRKDLVCELDHLYSSSIHVLHTFSKFALLVFFLLPRFPSLFSLSPLPFLSFFMATETRTCPYCKDKKLIPWYTSLLLSRPFFACC